MRAAVVMVVVFVVGCSSSSAPSEMEERARAAVLEHGRSGLSDAEIADAAAALVDMCEQGAESLGYRVGLADADPAVRAALADTCPDVIAD